MPFQSISSHHDFLPPGREALFPISISSPGKETVRASFLNRQVGLDLSLPVLFLFYMLRTLKDIWRAGWRVRVRCFVFGPHHKGGHRGHALCDHSTELD